MVILKLLSSIEMTKATSLCTLLRATCYTRPFISNKIKVLKHQMVWITQGENTDVSPAFRIAGIIRIVNFYWLLHSCRHCHWLLVCGLLPLNHTCWQRQFIACVLLVHTKAFSQYYYNQINYSGWSRWYVRQHLLAVLSSSFVSTRSSGRNSMNLSRFIGKQDPVRI
jgi:hypothetical protein